jgi:hypothetical protein
MSSTGKPGGFLSGLHNPVVKKPGLDPIVVSLEAEQAMGLAPPTLSAAAGAAPAIAPPAERLHIPAPYQEPEKSKTFFLPYAVCDRLEMQKVSERREMKHIVRQALEEYFEKNPLRQSVKDLYKD